MTSHSGNGGLGALGAFGMGMAVMYFLDPGRGARRRALVRDKLVHGLHKTEDAAQTTGRDLRNRARGLAAEVRARFDTEEVDDEVLVARVRAEMGRVVSHPGSIVVTASDGVVTLVGPVLADEAAATVARARGVRGVRDVVDRLELHEQAGDVPGLQGSGSVRGGGQFELLQENWTPAARLFVGAAGGVLTLAGSGRRDALGAAMSLAGLALLARSATNSELRDLVGVGVKGIDVQKAINIAAPVDDVFAFFTNYENFPRFMSHVREVRDTGEGGSHWVVDGPAGVPVEWDAIVTDLVPNEVLAWTSVPGSVVDNAGIIRFAQNEDGSAHVDLKMTYSPPAGAIGHATAKIFRADPKKQMTDDLARAKTFLETGTPARDAAQAG